MIKNIFWISITAVTLVTSSCATRKVTRVDPNQQIDLSGRWNDVDSKLTADAMTQQALGEIWLENFMRKNNGEQPVVIVGMVTNKSHEHIEAETPAHMSIFVWVREIIYKISTCKTRSGW